jgi:hypothetical protein
MRDKCISRKAHRVPQYVPSRYNDNLNLTVGYKSTFNSSSPGELRMDGFMISFVYGRLKSE